MAVIADPAPSGIPALRGLAAGSGGAKPAAVALLLIARHPAFEVAAGVAAGVTDAAVVGNEREKNQGGKPGAISSQYIEQNCMGVFLSNFCMARCFEKRGT